MKQLLYCLVLVLTASQLKADDAMKLFSKGFVKAFFECKKEMDISDQVMNDLLCFWKMDYSQLTRVTGCVLVCMSKKLDLIDETGKMRHGNFKEFALSQGVDANLATKVTDIIHGCEEEQQDSHEDQCTWVLEVCKCFRTRIHDLAWSPGMETIVGGVLTEI